MRFHGKVALITGGAAGIGAATAELMVSAGGKVLIADLREELAKELVSRHPGSMIFVALDVRSEESWVAAIAYCEATYGRLDVLVNCAGVSFISGQLNPENITIEEWRAVNSVNVEGTILGCKHAIPALRRTGGGAIVNLSSIGALIETSLLYAYGASKAAVSHVTKSVASYCAKNDFNIRCNAVLPGPTETEMYRTLTDAQRARTRGVSLLAIPHVQLILLMRYYFCRPMILDTSLAFNSVSMAVYRQQIQCAPADPPSLDRSLIAVLN